MAKLSDRIGRRKVLLGAIVAMMVAVVPAFEWMMQGSALAAAGDLDGAFIKVAAGQAILALILGWYLAPIPALLVEIFPTRIRYTGMSLSYNFCAIIGGLTPAIATLLIARTNNPSSIMYLLVGAGVITLVALLIYKDHWKEPLK